ncbi:MAG TPA: IPT/TIG domain-containing protein, partial [Vicinamibacteria bacterium]|nr:IPT/TIG domain-containing protein [Vicinamibacteria bacterium]
VFFRSAPVVESATPARSEPGQTITLAGKGFDPDAAANKVRFGDRPGQVSSVAAGQLVVTIPADLPIPPGGEVKVVVESRGKPSKPLSFRVYRAPRVTGLEPDVAMPGEEILINGQNLDGKPLTVNVGGMPADVKEAVPASVRVVVPQLSVTQGKVVPVSVQIGPDSAKPASLTVGYLPLVTEVKPNKGQAGEKVVIKGRGFDADVEDNEVYFGTQPALILAASETELTVVAPAALSNEGAVTARIHVKANGAISSSEVTFVHQRPSATLFIPHFFAAAVLAHPELAFVSTDIGPVLVLGGPEKDVKATAARAFEKAATLNALVDEAATKPPVFEVRSQPETSVGVQGRDAPILTVRAEDAAAYELTFEPGMRAKRPSVRGLAAYWAALLQDYFTLFVQKQRPLAVMALSPRGRVLMDIYSASLRVPGATGVPISVLRPLTPTMAKALHDLALVLPAEKESRVTVAVEGLWTGSMEESTGGPKTVQVRFRQTGDKLGGTFSTRAGKIEMNTPLRDVSFNKNEVRFTVDLSGSARTFTGTVQGGNLTGTIARGSDKTAGRFTLKYVE